MPERSRITGPVHVTVCLALGAALALVLAADLPRDTGVPPGMDPTAQRLRIEEQLVALNGKMDQLLQLLSSGNVKVVCVPADTDSRGSIHARTDGTISAPANGSAPAGGYAR